MESDGECRVLNSMHLEHAVGELGAQSTHARCDFIHIILNMYCIILLWFVRVFFFFFYLTGEQKGILVETGQQSFAPHTLLENLKFKVQGVIKQCSQFPALF
jgi:hypothetical protein